MGSQHQSLGCQTFKPQKNVISSNPFIVCLTNTNHFCSARLISFPTTTTTSRNSANFLWSASRDDQWNPISNNTHNHTLGESQHDDSVQFNTTTTTSIQYNGKSCSITLRVEILKNYLIWKMMSCHYAWWAMNNSLLIIILTPSPYSNVSY